MNIKMIDKNHFNYTEIGKEVWDEVYRLYAEEKLSLTKIVNRLKVPGLYTKKITEFLLGRGIVVKNFQNERGCNHDLFEKIDNEEKAYFLGFLYADGYVSSEEGDNSIELSVHTQDIDIIESFKQFIGSENKLYFCKKYKVVRYAFGSKKMKQDLINLGCIPRKSLVLKFPTEDQVPKHLIHHFIRGYFDGDGSIGYYLESSYKKVYYPRISMVGTLNFLQGIKNFLADKTNTKIVKTSECENTFELKLSHKKATSFLDQIYENSTIYLYRKHARYRVFESNNYVIKADNVKDINYMKEVYSKNVKIKTPSIIAI